MTSATQIQLLAQACVRNEVSPQPQLRDGHLKMQRTVAEKFAEIEQVEAECEAFCLDRAKSKSKEKG